MNKSLYDIVENMTVNDKNIYNVLKEVSDSSGKPFKFIVDYTIAFYEVYRSMRRGLFNRKVYKTDDEAWRASLERTISVYCPERFLK